MHDKLDPFTSKYATKSTSYLIDEDNSIGINRTKAHGPNSMLDHYLTKQALKERNCHFHCDKNIRKVPCHSCRLVILDAW